MHPEREHVLQIELATALRERDDARARADAAEAERDELRSEAGMYRRRYFEKGAESQQWAARAGALESALAAARRGCEGLRNDIAAWLLDRADQYETDDPIWVGIADLARGVARGDAHEAATHGELDADLYSRLEVAAPAAGEEGKR